MAAWKPLALLTPLLLLASTCRWRADQCELNATCPLDGGAGATPEGGTGAAPDAEAPCAPEHADCNGEPADGCEIHLATDGDHCGACGHACGGGGCQGGICQPYPILSGYNFGPLALDGAQLYWVGGNKVMTAGLDGTGAAVILDDPAISTFTYGIAVDDTNIYWMMSGSPTSAVQRVGKDGTGFTTLASGLATPQVMAADASALYVTLLGTSPNYTDRSVLRINKDGSGTSTLVTSASLSTNCLVVGNARTYWMEGSALFGVANDGSLPVNFGSVGTCPVAADDGLYLVSNGKLTKLDEQAALLSPVADLPKTGAFNVMAAHGSTLYLSDFQSTPRVLWRIGTNGSGAKELFPATLQNLVLDDHYAYWSTSVAKGFLMRAVR